MEINKPTRVPLSAQVVGEMERLISDGVWPVEGRIPPEPELVKLFGVSRNTVREAVQSLIHAGLLVAKPGNGTFVVGKSRLGILIHNELSATRPDMVFAARLALETGIAELAARNRTSADLEELNTLLIKRNTSQLPEADAAFHMKIAEATHNGFLTKFYNEICLYMMKNLPEKPLSGQTLTDEITLHNALFESIANSDSSRAKELTAQIITLYTSRF